MKDIAAKKNVSEVRRLTQEELLAEAVITEQLNLKSLGNKPYSDMFSRNFIYIMTRCYAM